MLLLSHYCYNFSSGAFLSFSCLRHIVVGIGHLFFFQIVVVFCFSTVNKTRCRYLNLNRLLLFLDEDKGGASLKEDQDTRTQSQIMGERGEFSLLRPPVLQNFT